MSAKSKTNKKKSKTKSNKRNFQNLIGLILALEVGESMKIDLSLGSRVEWNEALEELASWCILSDEDFGIRWYSSEVDEDNKITCYRGVEESEDEEDN
jgi:hypothetical protein